MQKLNFIYHLFTLMSFQMFMIPTQVNLTGKQSKTTAFFADWKLCQEMSL